MAFALTLGVGCKKSGDVESTKPTNQVRKDAIDKAEGLKHNVLLLAQPEAREHSAACKRGYRGSSGYSCPGPDFCNPPKMAD